MTRSHELKSVDERFELRASSNGVGSGEDGQPGLNMDDEVDANLLKRERHDRSEALYRLLNVFMPKPADLIEFVLDYSCGEVRFRRRIILP